MVCFPVFMFLGIIILEGIFIVLLNFSKFVMSIIE